ncbi:Peroxiredoxin-6 [Acipenser ruthenus]|uniref:Peroxiredoxin-6 n=1 Tax=Acipenser ruthenus TaxID=7906 RepID=A0A444U214_ACIRT|nr:Peroxiredoxin-6 [Acipenser ruthenus]
MPGVLLGDVFPNFEADTTIGKIQFHDFLGDSVQDHLAWSKDIVAYNGEAPDSTLPFPIIADEKRELAVQLGMLDPDEKDKDGIPLTARCPLAASTGCKDQHDEAGQSPTGCKDQQDEAGQSPTGCKEQHDEAGQSPTGCKEQQDEAGSHWD